jgi:hypothetical protein
MQIRPRLDPKALARGREAELTAAVTARLYSGRLVIPATVPEAKTLGHELREFQAKVTAAG